MVVLKARRNALSVWSSAWELNGHRKEGGFLSMIPKRKSW